MKYKIAKAWLWLRSMILSIGATRLAGGENQKTERVASPAAWTREIQPDAVMLFRYSALTLNGHRIHYDRKYATEVEGYPGLVVHGPLIATLLLDLLRRAMPDADVSRFQFEAIRPLFDLAA